jgi:hypothetical protein
MSSRLLEQAIRDKIRLSDGKKFQQIFWDIMILRYSDLQTPRMQHDLGNDGYSLKEKVFFACYAPESLKYDNADTKQKISDDYKDFCDNWKNKFSFGKWVFVTKDNLMGIPHQSLVDLNTNGDGVTKENFGLEQIVKEALCLEIADAVRIFDLSDSYLVNAINEEKDFGIIAEIFEFIFSDKIPSIDTESIKKSENYTELTEKISLNFSGEELEAAREMIVRNWQHKTLVGKYIEDETSRNPGRVNALIDKIQSDFRDAKGAKNHDTPIESVKIIEDLAKEYLAKDKQSNPDYVAGARAIILYFFELCFLGKKTKQESVVSEKLF